MTTAPASRPSSARTCSAPSSGWTRRATRTKAAPASACRSPATLRAAMAATSPSTTVRWAACGRSSGYRLEADRQPRRSMSLRLMSRVVLMAGLLFAAAVPALADEAFDTCMSAGGSEKQCGEQWIAREQAHVDAIWHELLGLTDDSVS